MNGYILLGAITVVIALLVTAANWYPKDEVDPDAQAMANLVVPFEGVSEQDGLRFEVQEISLVDDGRGIEVLVRAWARENEVGFERERVERIADGEEVRDSDGNLVIEQEQYDVVIAPNTPLGFGHDGTLEIGRFRIINPPLLVLSESGDIVRTYTGLDGEQVTMRFEENPQQALEEIVADLVEREGKEGTNIIGGKDGYVTMVMY